MDPQQTANIRLNITSKRYAILTARSQSMVTTKSLLSQPVHYSNRSIPDRRPYLYEAGLIFNPRIQFQWSTLHQGEGVTLSNSSALAISQAQPGQAHREWNESNLHSSLAQHDRAHDSSIVAAFLSSVCSAMVMEGSSFIARIPWKIQLGTPRWRSSIGERGCYVLRF